MFFVDLFIFIISLPGRRTKQPQDAHFIQKRQKDKCPTPVSPPESEKGLVSLNEDGTLS